MKRTLIAAIAGTLFALPAVADEKHHGARPESGASQPAAALAEGEVRKVDRGAKKITIKHGPLDKLDMPPMTMVFQVKDPALLDKVKPGDKVKFDVEKLGGGYVVTKIEPAR